MKYYSDPMTDLYQGDIREVVKELPLSACDMIMTSPPFYGLRAYKIPDTIWDGKEGCPHEWESPVKLIKHHAGETNPGIEGIVKNAGGMDDKGGSYCSLCGAWRGCLGNEPSPDLFVSHLCDIFDLLKPVLKKTATVWVNLADSYASTPPGNKNPDSRYSAWITGGVKHFDGDEIKRSTISTDVPAKSLIGIPERFVLEMQRRGYVRRNTIIWHKRNAMPESVSDRFTDDFDYLYLFSLQGKYFFERQFEPMARLWNESNGGSWAHASRLDDLEKGAAGTHRGIGYPMPNPLGRNMRAVWDIPTAPGLKGHYAQYPEKLCETPILAGCPLYVCVKCGKPRKKVYKTCNPSKVFNIGEDGRYSGMSNMGGNHQTVAGLHRNNGQVKNTAQLVGYSDCKCGAPFAPGVVLDPFVGTGTTLSVAKRLGRKSIGVDLSEKYCKLAQRRIEATQSPLILS